MSKTKVKKQKPKLKVGVLVWLADIGCVGVISRVLDKDSAAVRPLRDPDTVELSCVVHRDDFKIINPPNMLMIDMVRRIDGFCSYLDKLRGDANGVWPDRMAEQLRDCVGQIRSEMQFFEP